MIPAELYEERSAAWLTTPFYFGRRELLADTGDYFVLPWHPGVAVVLSESGPKAFANVCRHRQAIILSGRGNVSQIRCSMHGWSWDMDGKSSACPGFDQGADLLTFDLAESKGWMYAPGSTLANATENNPHMGLDGYELLEINAYEYDCSWIDYMNTTIDLNHIPFIHPGLRAWTDCSKPEIIHGEGWMTQSAPFRDGGNAKGLTKIWWDTLADRVPDATTKNVRWTQIYPNIMIEDYGGIFISVAVAQPTEGGCVGHETVWLRGDLAGDAELGKAFSEMFEELEDEDQKFLMAQHKGRKALMSMRLRDTGPYQDPIELGIAHFHQWLLDRVAEPSHSVR
jgi:phenylpropionate dioxygenase-like ring-hydroxylating dioxygenase large terminal subunit